ncbi:MAG TPA: helix-turn-helix transcriptional regulator [Flavobacterium sp.]|nr:helix-turn-helix transcriptional regulator [Flavobacterium sp.]
MNNIKDKEFISRFGQNLKKIRSSKKLSQESLAYSADIPISQIGRIERGEINTTISTVSALAKALDLHPSELLQFD